MVKIETREELRKRKHGERDAAIYTPETSSNKRQDVQKSHDM
jgi:hypothetical protein